MKKPKGEPCDCQNVDVMIGNEEDFTACLGFEVEGVDEAILQRSRKF